MSEMFDTTATASMVFTLKVCDEHTAVVASFTLKGLAGDVVSK